ncbi:MAG: hypothetical protein U0V72_12245 [Cytophagales bacterium]
MIKVEKTTKVYAYCPSNVVTGGAELLHQLISTLNKNNIESYIVYFDDNNSKIPNDYEKYNLKIAKEIDDNPKNIVVFYEGIFEKTKLIKNAQILLWWLSVDNFYLASRKHLSLLDYFSWNWKYGFIVIARRLGHLILKRKNYFFNNISLKQIKELNALNCYQSEYAQFYLNKKGFKETFPLTDYINTEFITSKNPVNKERKILYNPKKGINYTRKIMKLLPNEKWVALENMTRDQLKNELQTSMLYIDFGFHPGKDRIPREAVLSDCCIITGRQGSANHFEDVCINEFYKIDEKKIAISKVRDRIIQILNNYNSHIENFELYKKRIIKEKEVFEEEVKYIFQINN